MAVWLHAAISILSNAAAAEVPGFTCWVISPWMDDGRGRVWTTPREHFFFGTPKIIKNPEVMFWNFQISWKTQPNQQKKGWFIMVWPRNFDEFWVEIFGEGYSRKELREINPKDAGKKKRLKRGCPLSYEKMSSWGLIFCEPLPLLLNLFHNKSKPLALPENHPSIPSYP